MAQRADDRPRRVWTAEQLPVAQRDAGEQVQRVPEQRGLRRRADEQLPIDPPAVRNRELVEPPRVVLRRAAQPAAHGGVRPAQRGGDGPEPRPGRLGGQRVPDHFGGIGASSAQRIGQQYLRGPALFAARSPWGHRQRRCPQAANGAGARVSVRAFPRIGDSTSPRRVTMPSASPPAGARSPRPGSTSRAAPPPIPHRC